MTDQTSTNQQSVATTGQPHDFPISAYLPTSGGGILASILGTVLSGMWLRRRLSRDNLEVAKDTSEKRLLQTITEERDRAVASAQDAWNTRAEDARLIGQLTSEVKHLTETNRYLISDVSGLRDEIGQLREIIYSLLPPEIAEKMRKTGAPLYSKTIREVIEEEARDDEGSS